MNEAGPVRVSWAVREPYVDTVLHLNGHTAESAACGRDVSVLRAGPLGGCRAGGDLHGFIHLRRDAAGKPALMIALNAPAQRRGQSPLWQADPRAIMLRVALLADPVDEIEGAFLAFIRA